MVAGVMTYQKKNQSLTIVNMWLGVCWWQITTITMMMMMKKLSIATDKMVQLLFFLFCFVLTKQYSSGYNVILFFSRMGGEERFSKCQKLVFQMAPTKTKKWRRRRLTTYNGLVCFFYLAGHTHMEIITNIH